MQVCCNWYTRIKGNNFVLRLITLKCIHPVYQTYVPGIRPFMICTKSEIAHVDNGAHQALLIKLLSRIRVNYKIFTALTFLLALCPQLFCANDLLSYAKASVVIRRSVFWNFFCFFFAFCCHKHETNSQQAQIFDSLEKGTFSKQK